MVGRVRKVVEETKGKIRPLGDRVLVKLELPPLEKYTEGGIALPPSVVEDRVTARGTVKALGPGHEGKDGSFTPLDVEENDIILFGKYAGTEVKVHGEEYRIMHFADILGILAEPEDNPDYHPFETDDDEESDTE